MGAHYFLGNRLLGQSVRAAMWDDWQPLISHLALLCPTCGELWGRVTVERATDWSFQRRACNKHGNGSFIAPWANQFEELPPEVLAYELNLRLDKYERENRNEIQRPSGT